MKVPRGAVLGCGISIPFRRLCHLEAILFLGIKIQILAVCLLYSSELQSLFLVQKATPHQSELLMWRRSVAMCYWYQAAFLELSIIFGTLTDADWAFLSVEAEHWWGSFNKSGTEYLAGDEKIATAMGAWKIPCCQITSWPEWEGVGQILYFTAWTDFGIWPS